MLPRIWQCFMKAKYPVPYSIWELHSKRNHLFKRWRQSNVGFLTDMPFQLCLSFSSFKEAGKACYPKWQSLHKIIKTSSTHSHTIYRVVFFLKKYTIYLLFLKMKTKEYPLSTIKLYQSDVGYYSETTHGVLWHFISGILTQKPHPISFFI